MESGVEDRDLRGVGHRFAHEVDAGIGGRVVERCELFADGKLFAHGLIDDDRAREVFATGHHAVADRIDLRKAADGRLGVVHQDIEQLSEAFLHGHISHVIGGLLEIGGERNVHECAWRANLFSKAFHQRYLAIGFDQLAFERRASCIHYEHAHRHLLF